MERPARYLAVQPPDPGITPSSGVVVLEWPPDPGITPPPDMPPCTVFELATGAVGLVQAVARARSAAASVKRTSMYTSEALCS
jgi:hypothetical protein